MKEKLSKLIDVKTIVTFALIGSVIALAFLGKVDAKEISILATTVVAFFFGVKKAESNKADV